MGDVMQSSPECAQEERQMLLVTDIGDGDRVLFGGRWRKVRHTTRVGPSVSLNFAGEPSRWVSAELSLPVIRRLLWESRIR